MPSSSWNRGRTKKATSSGSDRESVTSPSSSSDSDFESHEHEHEDQSFDSCGSNQDTRRSESSIQWLVRSECDPSQLRLNNNHSLVCRLTGANTSSGVSIYVYPKTDTISSISPMLLPTHMCLRVGDLVSDPIARCSDRENTRAKQYIRFKLDFKTHQTWLRTSLRKVKKEKFRFQRTVLTLESLTIQLHFRSGYIQSIPIYHSKDHLRLECAIRLQDKYIIPHGSPFYERMFRLSNQAVDINTDYDIVFTSVYESEDIDKLSIPEISNSSDDIYTVTSRNQLWSLRCIYITHTGNRIELHVPARLHRPFTEGKTMELRASISLHSLYFKLTTHPYYSRHIDNSSIAACQVDLLMDNQVRSAPYQLRINGLINSLSFSSSSLNTTAHETPKNNSSSSSSSSSSSPPFSLDEIEEHDGSESPSSDRDVSSPSSSGSLNSNNNNMSWALEEHPSQDVNDRSVGENRLKRSHSSMSCLSAQGSSESEGVKAETEEEEEETSSRKYARLTSFPSSTGVVVSDDTLHCMTAPPPSLPPSLPYPFFAFAEFTQLKVKTESKDDISPLTCLRQQSLSSEPVAFSSDYLNGNNNYNYFMNTPVLPDLQTVYVWPHHPYDASNVLHD